MFLLRLTEDVVRVEGGLGHRHLPNLLKGRTRENTCSVF